MTIFQPRRNHVDTYETTVAELLDWGENEFRPKAKLAAEGKGEFTAGDHCRFCKIRANCRKRAEYNSLTFISFFVELEDVFDIAIPDEIYVETVYNYTLNQFVEEVIVPRIGK